ncbi:uncharacterized protein C2orf78-like [Littorina saxatilis]|uniref:Uncharacterized protein n=1 Tax=Littorina saxatilis TaxID=31220 RepID=A0AAN9C1V7_9CAEN
MATTTRGIATTTTTTTTSSPLRRHPVWSHNTSYTGAAGVHSEVSKQSQAFQVTSQKQLTTSLSTTHTIHQKELRSLNQHRKSLEMSMLSYTKRMRKISADRGLRTGFQFSPTLSDQPASSGELTTSALERWLTFSKTGQADSSCSHATTKDTRDSTDTVMEDIEADAEKKERKPSDDRLFKVVRKLPKEPTQNIEQRPASFHTLDSIVAISKNSETSDRREQSRNISSGHSNTTGKSPQRKRRPGTAEKPDPTALGLNQRTESQDSNTDTRQGTSPTEDFNTFLAITPFPERLVSGSSNQHRLNGLVTSVTDDEESYYAAHSSRKRVPKTRENYWSFRTAHHRRSLLLANTSKNQPHPEPCPSPRLVAPRPIRKQKLPPLPAKKTFYHTFRYSDAVDNVLRSFDDRYSDRITHTAIRRVAESLPTLDIEELRLQRKKTRGDRAQSLKAVPERRRFSQDTHGSIDTQGDTADEQKDIGGFISRERSMSAPVVFLQEDDESSIDDGEDTEFALKPVLKKVDDTYVNGVLVRKNVQFHLPSTNEQTEMRTL